MLSLDFIKNEYEFSKTELEKVEEQITIDILSGKLRKGKRIVEKDLCERFSLSRTPVRQVLQKIALGGLIRIEPNKGAVVKGLSKQDIEDMLCMKMILEPQAVKWAIERITEEEMDMLEETFNFMEFYTTIDDINKMVKINHGFDCIIYDAAKNKEIETLLLRYDMYIKHAGAQIFYPKNYLSSLLDEHRAIYQAFVTRDTEAGYEAAQIHAYKSMLRMK